MPHKSKPKISEEIGAKVGGGMTWMTLSAVITRVATFLAQILMGHWLEPEDFSLYATATAVAGFLMVCRDMATGYIIVQRGAENYEENAGPAFWLGFLYDSAVFVVTLAIAFPLATRIFHDPKLAPMLIVMAATLPFGAVANVLYSRLRLTLHFKAFSLISGASAFIRQVAMIVFAKFGFGPMSFAWPVLVCILVDVGLLLWFTGDFVWMRSPGFKHWRNWIHDALWLMFTSFANFGLDWAPYLVLGPILGANSRVTGFYFFAYQITAQIGLILAFNASVVLTPALQRLNNEPKRQCEAALRSLRTLMLAACVASLGLASIMGPLEHLLWQGKYANSVAAVLIFGAFYPWRITYGLCSSVQGARGDFRQLGVMSALECVGLMVATLIAGLSHPTATGIAWWTGGWVLLSRLVATLYVFTRMGATLKSILLAMFPAWLVCLAGLGASILVSREVAVRNIVQGIMHASKGDKLFERVADVAEMLLYGGVCGILMIILCRVILHADLRDVLRVAPGRLRAPMQRLLRLTEDPMPQAPLP